MKAKNSKSKQFQILKGLPVWNLVDLYPSISSKKIQTDLNFIRKESKFFEKKYKGKITKLSSLQLYTAITHLEKIDEIIDKILSYAHLLVAENTNEEKNKIFFAGRLADYKYINTDEAVETGLLLAKKILKIS